MGEQEDNKPAVSPYEPQAEIADPALADAVKRALKLHTERMLMTPQQRLEEKMKAQAAEVRAAKELGFATDPLTKQLSTVVLDDDGKQNIAKWLPVEAVFYTEFIKDFNMERAVKDSGIEMSSALRLIYTPKFGQMVHKSRMELAKSRRSRDAAFLDSFAHDVLTGNKKITREQADIFKTMLKRANLMPRAESNKPRPKLDPFNSADNFVFVAKKGNISGAEIKQAADGVQEIVEAEVVNDIGEARSPAVDSQDRVADNPASSAGADRSESGEIQSS